MKNLKKPQVEASPLPPATSQTIKEEFTFPEAVEAVMRGKKVRRKDWVDGSEFCLLKDNFLMIHRGEKFHGWIVSEGDMLAIDWVII